MIKEKFQNCFQKVQKAFLALDSDHDGFIAVEDFMRYLGSDLKIDYDDLKKLIKDKDSKGRGQLSYADFSRWIGSTINQPEGFYFRHDSSKNPQYDSQQTKYHEAVGAFKKATDPIKQSDLEAKIFTKIQYQWKTLRKAFTNLNFDKSGAIRPQELRYMLNYWGIDVTEDRFQEFFNKLDADGDGLISYKDFCEKVGKEIHPGETLYFRLDKPSNSSINSCKESHCWQATQSYAHYCNLHQKMH